MPAITKDSEHSLSQETPESDLMVGGSTPEYFSREPCISQPIAYQTLSLEVPGFPECNDNYYQSQC